MAYTFSERLKDFNEVFYQVNDDDHPDCSNCRFSLFDAVRKDSKLSIPLIFVTEFGVCRRHAPLKTGEIGEAIFPRVHVDNWCGDHELAINEVNDA